MPLLSEGYYLEHFWQVIDGVETRYGFLLTDREHAYINHLRSLPAEASRLYVRLANRKGPFFRIDTLSYAEIVNMEEALRTLHDRELLMHCNTMPAFFHHVLVDEAEELHELALGCWRLAELRSLVGTPTARKADLCTQILADELRGEILSQAFATWPLVAIPPSDPWVFLRYLFFGELAENLADFVTRDLGHIVPETHAVLALRFANRAEAEEGFRMARRYARFRQLRRNKPAAEIYDWWQRQCESREELGHIARPTFDRLVSRLGRLLEREGNAALAITLYATSPCAPSRERLARLYMRHARFDEARALCQEMLGRPCDADEAYAAARLLERMSPGRSPSPARRMQKEGEVLHLPVSERVEEVVLAYYQRDGWYGAHAENWLWNALFGLLFWDIIYDASYGTFHQPLQRAPADLGAQFYERRAAAIEARLTLLADRNATLELLRQHAAAKAGIANPFVGWHPDLMEMVEALVLRLPAQAVVGIMRAFAQNPASNRRGFPDLFLWRGEEYRFLEVKSPNDQLSPQQYYWLTLFAELGVAVGVQCVVWLELEAS